MPACALKAIPLPADPRRVLLAMSPCTVSRPGRGAEAYAGTVEPDLDEMIADPIVRRLMARDGVSPDGLGRLIDRVRARLDA